MPTSVGGAPTLLDQLFAAVPPERQDELRAITGERQLPEGTVLLREGGRFDVVGYIIDGALGMEKRLADGRLHIVGLLLPGDMFGRLFDGPSGYDFVALTPVRLLQFERDRFEHLLTECPEAESLLVARILDELDSAREWLLLMGGRRVEERVAAFVLVLFRRTLRRSGEPRRAGGWPEIRVPVRRADLARYLGTRPETLSRAFRQLQARGAIRMADPYTFQVVSLPRLVRASGSDLVADDR